MEKGSTGRQAAFLVGLSGLMLLLAACGSGDADFTGLSRSQLQIGIIQGIVRDLDLPNTPPLTGIKVEMTPEAQVTVTDAQGFFQFKEVIPGYYHLTALRPGNIFGQQTSANAKVVGGDVVTANLDFGQGPGVANASEVAFLSSNGTDSVFSTKITGTDIRSVKLTGIPNPLITLAINRASSLEYVVEARTGTNSGIYRGTVGGGSGFKVIDNATQETHPDFSPDGSRIVYAGDKDADGNFELYLINRDGTGETLLLDDFDAATGGTFDSRDPSWSPDGMTILFASRRTDLLSTADERDYEIQSLRVEGGPVFSLTQDLLDDRDPTWHPNSTTIFFAKRTNGFYQLYISTAQITTAEIRLSNNFFDDRAPTVSLDGKHLGWITRSNLGGLNPDGGAEVAVAGIAGTVLTNPRLLSQFPSTVSLSSPDFRPAIP
jgi:hypothetical protein